MATHTRRRQVWHSTVLASTEELRKIVDHHQAALFVWPDEGRYTLGGWEFNRSHDEFEPLWFGPFGAAMMLTVRDNLKAQHLVERFDDFVARSRGHCMLIYEFAAKHVRPVGRGGFEAS